MATFFVRPLPFFWNGAAYTASGEGNMGLPDGDGTVRVSGLLTFTPSLSHLPVTHTLVPSPMSLLLGDANEVLTDETPPTIGAFSPADGASIDETDTLSFEVTDDEEVALVLAYVSLDGGTPELVYDSGTATPGFEVVATPISGGHSYEVSRDAGWFGAVALSVVAVDSTGNLATGGAEYEAPEAEEEVGDVAAPVVSNVTPAPGNLMPTQSVSIDVTDDSGALAMVLLVAQFAFLDAPELVHDGANFTAPYAAHSTREAIANGWRYTLLRNTGWPGTFTLTPYALDAAGNQAA